MLSSVAERLYWMSRYLERSENIARLIQSYNHLIFDIPLGAEPDWFILIEILDAEETFDHIFSSRNEANVHRFLISRLNVSNSITYSVNSARENVRTTRDVLPEDVWEQANQLYLYTDENAMKSIGRRNRLVFLEEIIKRFQALNGLIESSLPRDEAYRFISIGRKIERADMTARILKVAGGDIISREKRYIDLQAFLWGALLDALYARSAFRRIKGPVISKEQTLDFILNCNDFPRSIIHCVSSIDQEVTNLPDNHEIKKILKRQKRLVNKYKSDITDYRLINKFNEEFQEGLIKINKTLYQQWFER